MASLESWQLVKKLALVEVKLLISNHHHTVLAGPVGSNAVPCFANKLCRCSASNGEYFGSANGMAMVLESVVSKTNVYICFCSLLFGGKRRLC